MGSQSQPVTTTDVLNYAGELFYVGQKFGKSPLLSRKGMQSRSASGSLIDMGNTLAGDAPAQDGQTEDASIAAMTDTSYTGSQGTNNMQIFRKTYIVSYAAQAFAAARSGVNLDGGQSSVIASMPVQRLAHLKQTAADMEYSMLYGTSQVWSNAATTGAMGGLFTAVEGGSETAAGGAPLSKTLIETELIRMSAAGAEFGDVVISVGAFQLIALNNLYGNAIQSVNIGGTAVNRLIIPLFPTGAENE